MLVWDVLLQGTECQGTELDHEAGGGGGVMGCSVRRLGRKRVIERTVQRGKVSLHMMS